MAQTIVVLIRVVLGLMIGFAGLVSLSQGLVMVAHEEFTFLGPLALVMIAGIAIGSALLFGAWRLLSTTLRLPTQKNL
jgi:hypothetical protein